MEKTELIKKNIRARIKSFLLCVELTSHEKGQISGLESALEIIEKIEAIKNDAFVDRQTNKTLNDFFGKF